MLENNINTRNNVVDTDYLPSEKVRELYKFKQHSCDLDFGIVQNVPLKALFDWTVSNAIN